MAYVSLHNHTVFSIMHSLITPKELFRKTKELGQTAVAVTDSGSIGAAWDCLQESKATGVKLIIGCEMFFVDDLKDYDARLRHIILIAKNAVGYKNLLCLNAEGYDNFILSFKKAIPRIDWELLEKYKEGLICTTACGNGIISQSINNKDFDKARRDAQALKNIFGDNLAIELQAHNLKRNSSLYSNDVEQNYTNRHIKKLADELGIKCIVTTNAHYVTKDQYKSHNVLLAMASGQPLNSGSRLHYDVDDFYIKSEAEIFEKLERSRGAEEAKELIANTMFFADQCEFPAWIDPKFTNPSGKELPDFPVKDQADYNSFLEWNKEHNIPGKAEDQMYMRYWCETSLDAKLKNNVLRPEWEDKYRERMKEEYEVLEFHGFSSYMLIVADFVNWARRNNISVGPGRGSVASCLIGRLLDIHIVDPIQYNMIFARFHNKEKTSFPDIDMDIAPSGRDRVEQYIVQKYGKDNVAHVSNINTLTPKVYARSIARVHNYGGDRKTAVKVGTVLADSIPNDIKNVTVALEKAALFAEYAKQQYPELITYAKDLSNKPVAWATHAAGIVIGKRPLRGLVPLRKDKNGQISVEYEKERAEANGLIKIDLLGLDTLDYIDDTIKIVENLGQETPKAIDYDEYDKKAYDLISNGDTLCVFQLGTSGGTIDLCKKVKPKSIEEISMINSLARPSAKDIRVDFVETKAGNKPVSIMHPSLNRAFESTLGFGLYEECLMYLAHDVAGWTLHQADNLRKLTKLKGKYPEKVEKWKQEFIDGAEKNGVGAEVGKEIWEKIIENFGGYGFNKSLYFSELVDIYSIDMQYLDTKPIQDIRPGEYVRSRNESTSEDIFVEVLNLHDHGELDLVEVKLESGETINCTMDHKFRVKETGEMIPLWKIVELDYSIVIG